MFVDDIQRFYKLSKVTKFFLKVKMTGNICVKNNLKLSFITTHRDTAIALISTG